MADREPLFQEFLDSEFFAGGAAGFRSPACLGLD
jgi:hypothetical protein